MGSWKIQADNKAKKKAGSLFWKTWHRSGGIRRFCDEWFYNYRIYNNSDLIKYLDLKTAAIYGNSKSRKSLANIYAIYSILYFYQNEFFNNLESYRKFTGYDFTKLLAFCRTLYGGEKIQNHALNSRLNLEFDNKIASQENKGKFIIVQNNGKYLIHPDYIYVLGKDISKTVIKIIDKYIELLRNKDDLLIKKLENLCNENNFIRIKEEIKSLLTDDSEARVFEIISYAILKNYYKNIYIYIGTSLESIRKEQLTLSKTGRTNANDGGIDFVMRPIGRFFQVTEVGNYDKYFLDIEKVLHFPITFVIKTNKDKDLIKKELNDYIKNKTGGLETLIKRYNDTIEEIITINELRNWYNQLDDISIKNILDDIILYYRVEMNFND